jgi:hypothetical protein
MTGGVIVAVLAALAGLGFWAAVRSAAKRGAEQALRERDGTAQPKQPWFPHGPAKPEHQYDPAELRRANWWEKDEGE